MPRSIFTNLTIVVAVAALALAALSGARAEPQPAFDRPLVERLVRAQEAQTRALEKLVSAAERCKR